MNEVRITKLFNRRKEEKIKGEKREVEKSECYLCLRNEREKKKLKEMYLEKKS